MFLALTLFHIGTTYICKLFSLLQFTLQWHNLLLLGLVNRIFKYCISRLLISFFDERPPCADFLLGRRSKRLSRRLVET